LLNPGTKTIHGTGKGANYNFRHTRSSEDRVSVSIGQIRPGVNRYRDLEFQVLNCERAFLRNRR
jgi:hypothetical protein